MSLEVAPFEGDKVAVYGTLRQGHGNNSILLMDKAELLGTEEVSGFGMISLGGFPAVYPGESNQKITVEVFKVNNEETKNRLDRLEGYPGFYNRKLIDTSHGKAWMYIIESYDKNTDNQIEGGNWNEYTESRGSSRYV